MQIAAGRHSPMAPLTREEIAASRQAGLAYAAEARHFRLNFASRPYARRDAWFEDFEPAYRLGCDARHRFEGMSFEEIEPQLEAEWYSTQPSMALTWQQVSNAARDAWDYFAPLPRLAESDRQH